MPRSARYSLATLGVLGITPFAAMLVWAWRLQPLRSLSSLLATTILVLLILGVFTRTWRRFFLFCLPLFILADAYAVYSIWFRGVPGQTLAVLLLGATWEECAGLIMTGGHKWMLPVIGAFVAYVWMAWRLPAVAIFKGWSYRIARLLLVAVIPLAAYASFDSNELIDGAALNPVVGSFMFFGGQMPRIYAQLHGSLTNKIPYHAKRMDRSEEVHVLVVGESARRGSWSVYGYSRPTTPYLNSLKARGEAIFFQDVMADANLTQNAVPIILTGIPPGRILNANISGNLFDLAREAGYSTAWLVNQDIEITMLAGVSVDPLETPPDPRPSLFGRVLQDATLLPVYRREIGRTGTARFIGLHVMGSHWEYYKRYPSTFERFGNADGLGAASIMFNNLAVEKALVGTYDNSVLYTDWFLGQIIDEARKLAVPATVTFVPDHGEDLAEFDGGSAGHGDPSYQPSQFKIPAFIWANEGYRRAHPQIIEAIQRNASAEIRSRNIFYAMADIMGITWPAQQPAQSYASPRFVPDASGPLLAGGVLVPAPQ